MEKHATPDLMQYIRVLAHQQDGSKLEKQCGHELAVHADTVVAAKHQKQQKAANKALEKARQIEKVPWVESESDVDELTASAIKMQLEKYRLRVDNIPKKSEINKIKKS